MAPSGANPSPAVSFDEADRIPDLGHRVSIGAGPYRAVIGPQPGPSGTRADALVAEDLDPLPLEVGAVPSDDSGAQLGGDAGDQRVPEAELPPSPMSLQA